MSSERWRDIEGFPRYQVSDRGRVRVCPLGLPCSILKPESSDSGHLRVRLVDESGERRMRWVHRLVLGAFAGPPLVRHLDDDEQNNRLENLAYGSRLDNAADARRNGKHAHGSTVGTAKLSESKVRWIRKQRRRGVRCDELARRLGLSKAAVSAAARGDTWAHVDEPPVRGRRAK